MSKYIEVDAVMRELEREVELADDWKTAHEIANVVKYFPTADVRPNVHGEWAKICWKAFRCSECKNISEYYTDFCPNCGADMRKEVEK